MGLFAKTLKVEGVEIFGHYDGPFINSFKQTLFTVRLFGDLHRSPLIVCHMTLGNLVEKLDVIVVKARALRELQKLGPKKISALLLGDIVEKSSQ